jgi:hypothetical protein
MANKTRIRVRVSRWTRIYEEFVGHLITMMLVLASFRCIEWLYHLLWSDDRILLGFIRFSWLIDIADLFAFIAFVISGTMSLINAYREKP